MGDPWATLRALLPEVPLPRLRKITDEAILRRIENIPNTLVYKRYIRLYTERSPGYWDLKIMPEYQTLLAKRAQLKKHILNIVKDYIKREHAEGYKKT